MNDTELLNWVLENQAFLYLDFDIKDGKKIYTGAGSRTVGCDCCSEPLTLPPGSHPRFTELLEEIKKKKQKETDPHPL